MEFIKNGGEIIQAKIESAKKDGTNRVIITGDYEIEKNNSHSFGFSHYFR